MSALKTPDAPPRPAAADAWVGDLTHDLRQPLSTIQSAVCYLKLILRENERALAHLDLIEQQVYDSEAILTAAVASARRGFAQRGSTGEGSFDLTKVATAGLT